MKNLKTLAYKVKPAIPESNSLTIVNDEIYYYDENNNEYSLKAEIELPEGTNRQVLGYNDEGDLTAVTLGWQQFSDQPEPPTFPLSTLVYNSELPEGNQFGFGQLTSEKIPFAIVIRDDEGNFEGIVPTGGTSTTFLRGDGTWVTPTNTTYTAISESEFNTGTATTVRGITAVSLNRDITKKINDRIPLPPNTGTFILQSVDGVLTWITP